MNSQTLLNNRYQIIKSLGRGGFGETFLGVDTHLPSSRKCVIKQLKPIIHEPNLPSWMCDRFLQEARILESLGENHPQIPQLYAYFQENNNFFLVQEWIDGLTLKEMIEQKGVLSSQAVEKILIQILPVLQFIHERNIIHRDLKPDNIICRYDNQLPVLIDFGAVKEAMTELAHDKSHYTSSIAIGTPGYMPSEQAAGRPIYSSDLYSLGLTAIYLLTGKNPQYLQTDSRSGEILWRQEISSLHSNLAGVIDRAIRFNPRERFASAEEMLSALKPPVYPSEAKTVAFGRKLTANSVASPQYSNTSTPTSLKTKAVVQNRNSSHLSRNSTQRVISKSESTFSLNPFIPLIFLSLVAIASFFFGYKFFWSTNDNTTSNNLRLENPVDGDLPREKENNPLTQDKRSTFPFNKPKTSDNQIPESTDNNNPTDKTIDNEQPQTNQTEVENNQGNITEKKPDTVSPNSTPVIITASPLAISSIGASTSELNQRWGQPLNKNLTDSGNTVVSYNGGSSQIQEISYIIDNQTDRVIQVELIISPQSNIETIIATVNKALNGNITSGVQDAIAQVMNNETDLRSFNLSNYQGMIQKRQNRLEIRLWSK
ncbi:serine/threonine-protein kinase [Cyanobacterium sp. Dongsha4]|uniref:serine/threonine-protein kinase n=1 Tax=Cyanobacterium sp. DS4 TaxID=2878255 RepID=UPI002E7FF9BD|nr:serine/threonine-protein kinase [Cyanobacterium sp. Dongsha4]WVK99658.1 serine/threonine protein kinase [Cyanobacterium sp. Dongsha4]